MTVNIANVNVTTDTFLQWLDKTNHILTELRTRVVTADANTTSGNVSITGTFSSNSVVSNTITINTASVGSANLTETLSVANNLSVNSTALRVGNSTFNTSISYNTVITGNVVANVGFTIGNNIINSTSASFVGVVSSGNVSITGNSAGLLLGNSTVNAIANSTTFSVSTLIGRGTLTVGTNNFTVFANSTFLRILDADTSSNTRFSASSISTSGTLSVGNSSAVVGANSTVLRVANTDSTTSITPDAVNTIAIYTNSLTPRSGFTITASGDFIVSKSLPRIRLRKTADSGQDNRIVGGVGGSDRWSVTLGNDEAEGGGDTGTNFAITRHNDSGASVDHPIVINRATGGIMFKGVTFASLPAASAYSGYTFRVTDRSNRLATSDGTNWLYQDGNIAS